MIEVCFLKEKKGVRVRVSSFHMTKSMSHLTMTIIDRSSWSAVARGERAATRARRPKSSVPSISDNA
jgi:hypothetical protein